MGKGDAAVPAEELLSKWVKTPLKRQVPLAKQVQSSLEE